MERATRRTRIAAVLLIAALAVPAGEHLYWLLGGSWGLQGQDSTAGIRVVAALVVFLLLCAMLVVLARAGFWEQTLVPERTIRVLTWGMAVFFVGHGLMSFAEALAGMELEWWLYGPGGLVIGALMLVVASGGVWPRYHRRHRVVSAH